jgi:hypothetical protein
VVRPGDLDAADQVYQRTFLPVRERALWQKA